MRIGNCFFTLFYFDNPRPLRRRVVKTIAGVTVVTFLSLLIVAPSRGKNTTTITHIVDTPDVGGGKIPPVGPTPPPGQGAPTPGGGDCCGGGQKIMQGPTP